MGHKMPYMPLLCLQFINDVIATTIATIIRVVMKPARTAFVPVRLALVMTLADTGTATPIPTITATKMLINAPAIPIE